MLCQLWPMKVPSLWIASLLLAAIAAPAQTQYAVPVAINGHVPLGIESFRIEPAKHDFYLIASAETPAFVGLRRTFIHNRTHLVGRNGKEMSFYPERLQFRLTASTREKLIDSEPFNTELDIPLNQLLDKLHFRLKIFHGLAYHFLEPTFVEDVGMPRSLPYDERIYRIGFVLGKVPIEDRVVMEVISPSGDRLCKFHLDLL